MFSGGNALNFAAYSKYLQCDAAFLGVLADDQFADIVIKVIDTISIDRSHCIHAHGDTWLCSTHLENGERTISDDNDGGIIKKATTCD